MLALTLSPMLVAPVCLGDQVNLTCTASVDSIQWTASQWSMSRVDMNHLLSSIPLVIPLSNQRQL